MYGLVNKAIEQMVCAHFDTATWEAIKRRAEVDVSVFLSMHAYPDDVTYRLVDAASKTLERSHAEVLRAFGRYWTLYTAAEGYGELLNLTGATLAEFLQNLPNLHARIALLYPELHPPTFQCVAAGESTLLLHYFSERDGLEPMVLGLLEGLAERFATPIDITALASRAQGHDHAIFQIRFKASL